MAVGDGKTPPADRTDDARPTGSAACSITVGYVRIVNLGHTFFKDVANWRGKLTARMDFSVRKNSHEVKCRTTAVTSTSIKEFDSFSVMDYVE